MPPCPQLLFEELRARENARLKECNEGIPFRKKSVWELTISIGGARFLITTSSLRMPALWRDETLGLQVFSHLEARLFMSKAPPSFDGLTLHCAPIIYFFLTPRVRQ